MLPLSDFVSETPYVHWGCELARVDDTIQIQLHIVGLVVYLLAIASSKKKSSSDMCRIVALDMISARPGHTLDLT